MGLGGRRRGGPRSGGEGAHQDKCFLLLEPGQAQGEELGIRCDASMKGLGSGVEEGRNPGTGMGVQRGGETKAQRHRSPETDWG